MNAVMASFKVPAELQGVEEQLNHDYQELQKRPQSIYAVKLQSRRQNSYYREDGNFAGIFFLWRE